MEIRDYKHGDRAACLEIFDSNLPRFFAPDERSLFVAFLDTTLPGPFLVMMEEGRIIGCGGYRPRGDNGEVGLCWGMVHREHHGEGLGRRLLEARIARAEQDGQVRCILLETSQHCEGFFQHMGFETTEVKTDGLGPGLDQVDMVRVMTTDPEKPTP